MKPRQNSRISRPFSCRTGLETRPLRFILPQAIERDKVERELGQHVRMPYRHPSGQFVSAHKAIGRYPRRGIDRAAIALHAISFMMEVTEALPWWMPLRLNLWPGKSKPNLD